MSVPVRMAETDQNAPIKIIGRANNLTNGANTTQKSGLSAVGT
jgi:hypothetical protein